MDRIEKLEYQQGVEQYLEENCVYDLFERLLKDLIIEKPSNPLDFMISKLEEPTPPRIFIVGPPGSNRKEHSLALAEHFNYSCISVGDLLQKEISKRSAFGQEIEEARKSYSFIDDNIVIEIVKKQIEVHESEKKGYILEGFPRTRVQAISLQKAGIIPEKFILLEADDDTITNRVKSNLSNREVEGGKTDYNMNIHSNNALLEYNLNISGVKELYHGFYNNVNVNSNNESILEEIARLIKMKTVPRAPRRPPRIIIMGPPGSGRSSQAQAVATRYGLVHVSSEQLLKSEISRKTEMGKLALKCINQGEVVPDEMLIPLIENRLKQSDAKINGWIMDGYPKTLGQIEALTQMGCVPTLVILLEISDVALYERIEDRKLDPVTGEVFAKKKNPTKPEVAERLITNPADSREVIKKRLQRYKNTIPIIDQALGKFCITISAEKDFKNITQQIGHAIEHPKVHK